MLSSQDRLAVCWHIQDCYGCINAGAGCGWCPLSSACVPASSLLDPVSHPGVCPLAAERFELRTRALGCGCSTTTLLSVIVTVFATIAALGVLYGVGTLLSRLNPFLGEGTWTGTEVEVKSDRTRVERVWYRDTWGRWMWRLWERPDLKNHSEQEERTERSRLLG